MRGKMAATIKVDLDVDQAKFLAFSKAFDTFSKGIDGSASKWDKINGSMRQAAESSRALVETGSEALDHVDKARTAILSMKPATDAISRGWNSLSTSTGKVAGNIKDATLALLKWSGITALIGGGAWGLGSLGMTAIGSSVTAERSAALGAGTTYGGRQAFNIAFRRFGDPEGVLSRIGVLKGSAEHSALTNLGLTDHEIDTMDTADLSAKAYKLLGEKAQNVNPSMLKDWLGQYRFNDAFSLEQARLAKGGVKSGEMGELQGIFSTSKGRFNTSDESQVAWVNFVLEMEIAKGRLNKTFAGALAPLTPSLIKISESFTHLAEKIGQENGPLARTLERFNSWLLEVTKNVSEKRMRESIDNFISKIKDFVSLTAQFVKKLAEMLHWFGLDVPKSLIGNGGSTGRGRAPGFRGGSSGMGGEGGGGGTGMAASGGGTGVGAGRPGSANPEKRANAMKIAMDQLRKEGVPEDKLEGAAALLVGEAESESGLKANISHDNGTGYGIYGARLRRRDEMFEWMAKHGYGRDSFEGQMRQMAHAAASGEWAGPEGKRAEARRLIMQGATDVGSVNRFTGSFESPARINARAGSVWAAKNSMKTRVTIKKTPGNDSTEAASAASQQTP